MTGKKPTGVAEAFLDTNIVLQIISASDRKAVRARELIDAGALISAQVLNEFVSVARRKYNISWFGIREIMAPVMASCRVLALTMETHALAVQIAEEAMIDIYDANIVAAAELAGCDTLYTEDLNAGQRIGGVTIRNPFA